MCNCAVGMASVQALFVSRGPGPSKYNPTVIALGRMYHEVRDHESATGMLLRLTSLYIHDTEHTTSNRKHIYSSLRESLLHWLALMLEENNNNLVKPFISLRKIIQRNRHPDYLKLVIHAHGKTIAGHIRKCNLPEAREVAALVFGV